MKFHIWQSLYILWVNQYYLKDLPHRKCKIIALKETPKGEGWNDYELVCEVLGDETRFKVNYDSFWFTHPKTRNTETDEEEDFKITPSDQYVSVVLTAKELYKIIKEKRVEYHQKDVDNRQWRLEDSIKTRDLYNDPKNIKSDIAKWIKEEEIYSEMENDGTFEFV